MPAVMAIAIAPPATTRIVARRRAAQPCAEVAEQPERDQRRDHDDAGPYRFWGHRDGQQWQRRAP